MAIRTGASQHAISPGDLLAFGYGHNQVQVATLDDGLREVGYVMELIGDLGVELVYGITWVTDSEASCILHDCDGAI